MAIASVVATINGESITLSYNASTQRYEATITAPTATSGSNNGGEGPGVGAAAQGKGYYPVEVVATDTAGNETTINDESTGALGQSCRLKVLEKTAPTISITNPTSGAFLATSTPEIAVTCTDSGSGINPSTCVVQIDSGALLDVTLSGSGTTYTGTLAPSALSDGEHTITAYVYDWDGNKSNVASVTFTVDTVAPTLTISSPTDGLVTNLAALTVSGTTNDSQGTAVTITVSLNGADQGAVTVGSGGAFSKAITLATGQNTIVVRATDAAGKYTEVTRTVTLDQTPPSITSITISPNPVDGGATYIISVQVSD